MLIVVHFAKRISGITIGARLIEWGQNTNFSHTAIEMIENPEGDAWVFESVYPKSRRILKKEWLKHYESIESYSFIIDDANTRYEIRKALYDNLGIDYSPMQLVLIGIGIALKLVEKFIDKITLNAKKYLICAEYVSDILYVLGAKFKDNSDTITLVDCQTETKKLKGLI